jgi:alpha-glucoside transport system substrate-binding protein
MGSRTTRARRGLLASASVLALVLAACGGDNKKSTNTTSATTAGGNAPGGSTATTTGGATPAVDIKGKTVKVAGPETGAEADGLTAGMADWTKSTGAKFDYSGSRDFETQIRVALQGGDTPDIAMFPQPGTVKGIADKVTALPDDLVAKVKADYPDSLTSLVVVNGKTLGIPVKADVKSLVWYSPAQFTKNGYKVPTTWAEFTALQDQIRAKSQTPWCIGIESGDATGWPFTDWVEDWMLRMHGPDVYAKWVNHQIPFNDPQVKDVVQAVSDIWFKDGNVLNGRASIASTGFATAGLPVLDGKCFLHRQANFYGAQFKTAKPDVKFGPNGDVDAFYLPPINDQFGAKPLLSAGVFAVAFNNKPETMSALAYIESADFANARIKSNKSGFLSPNKKQDFNAYVSDLDRTFAKILTTSNPVVFDASDSMPAKVGSGSFWKEGTNYVNGTEDLDTFLNNVEKSWPK